LNYLDSYKACIIGINQSALGSESRQIVTDQQMLAKRKEAELRG